MNRIKSIYYLILILILMGGCSSCTTFKTFGCNNSMTDKNITTNLQVSIAGDTGLADLNIEVYTYRRVVTLKGAVENPTQIRIAMAKAAAIPCVKCVISKLVIKHFY